jgi:3-oxoadipate enol-lactonase
VSAVRLHHAVAGPADAPVALLLPPLGGTVDMWEPQVPALADRRRVVRVDTRGHGSSPVPPGPYDIDDLVDDVLALLDQLGVPQADVVGLSLGGMTALRLAATRPERVARVAVLCTSALLGPARQWADRAATVRAHGTGAIATAVVARWFTDELRASDLDLVRWAEAMVSGVPAEGYASCCGVIERLDLRADLPRIRAPLLAIAGAEDPATPPEHLEAIAAGVPGARLLVVPGAAHLANVERPAAVNSALIAHLTAGT